MVQPSLEFAIEAAKDLIGWIDTTVGYVRSLDIVETRPIRIDDKDARFRASGGSTKGRARSGLGSDHVCVTAGSYLDWMGTQQIWRGKKSLCREQLRQPRTPDRSRNSGDSLNPNMTVPRSTPDCSKPDQYRIPARSEGRPSTFW